jgi:hypothetical protein
MHINPNETFEGMLEFLNELTWNVRGNTVVLNVTMNQFAVSGDRPIHSDSYATCTGIVVINQAANRGALAHIDPMAAGGKLSREIEICCNTVRQMAEQVGGTPEVLLFGSQASRWGSPSVDRYAELLEWLEESRTLGAIETIYDFRTHPAMTGKQWAQPPSRYAEHFGRVLYFPESGNVHLFQGAVKGALKAAHDRLDRVMKTYGAALAPANAALFFTQEAGRVMRVDANHQRKMISAEAQ